MRQPLIWFGYLIHFKPLFEEIRYKLQMITNYILNYANLKIKIKPLLISSYILY